MHLQQQPKRKEISCKFCGTKFVYNTKHRIYCSAECRTTSNNHKSDSWYSHFDLCKYCGFQLTAGNRNGFCWECVRKLKRELGISYHKKGKNNNKGKKRY